MNSWSYEGKIYDSVENFPKNCFGFIYLIQNKKDKTFYIGKKYLYHSVKRKLSKKNKALLEGTGRKPTYEVIQKESDWKIYWGSSKQLHEDVKKQGLEDFNRVILDFAFNKKQLTYLEIKHQIINNVLEDPKSLNDNILGKFFRKDFSSQD
jgi:hypothetical protein